MALVRRKLAFDVEKSALGMQKMIEHFVEDLDVFPISVYGIKTKVLVQVLRQRQLKPQFYETQLLVENKIIEAELKGRYIHVQTFFYRFFVTIEIKKCFLHASRKAKNYKVSYIVHSKRNLRNFVFVSLCLFLFCVLDPRRDRHLKNHQDQRIGNVTKNWSTFFWACPHQL